VKYLSRNIDAVIKKYKTLFPAVALTGPRQSGKSTTLQHLLTDYIYITFDDPINLEFFNNDPKGFIKQYSDKIIFDEAQKVPNLFNYLKMEVDKDRGAYGKYILTGSSQFSFIKNISESLAGRIGMLSLLPFEYVEIPEHLRNNQIVFGSYPELIVRDYKGYREWYASYTSNYVERDVRSLYNIGNLRDFQRFVFLLAANTSQELNMNKYANDIGVTVKTVKAWISVLEASYIVFLLTPYYKNLGKRIVKRPKLYFFDTGLLCYLTGIDNETILNKGPMAGPIFENYVISEIHKSIAHHNVKCELYYFRDNLGIEVDLIMENNEDKTLNFIEIKNNHTPKIRMADPLKKLLELEKDSKHILPFKLKGSLVYKGEGKTEFAENISAYNYKEFLLSNAANPKSI
jgi:predicted AAA+ superfamily ATPase